MHPLFFAMKVRASKKLVDFLKSTHINNTTTTLHYNQQTSQKKAASINAAACYQRYNLTPTINNIWTDIKRSTFQA